MNKTWGEELWKRNNTKLSLEEEVDMIRGSLLAKLTMAYNCLTDSAPNTFRIENVPMQLVSTEELLANNFKEECLRMMLVNYSVVLIGMGKNDKVSLHNDPILSKNAKVQEFYETKKAEIKYLKMLRDKVYSHYDPDIEDLLVAMPLQFIKELILFVTEIIGIENPRIRPK